MNRADLTAAESDWREVDYRPDDAQWDWLREHGQPVPAGHSHSAAGPYHHDGPSGAPGGLGDTNVWFVTLPDTVPVADLLPPGVGSAKRPTGTDGEPREWATTRHETETNRADPPAPSTHHDVAAIVEDGSTRPGRLASRDFLTQHRVGQPESADPATAPVLAARGWLRSNGAVVRAALVGMPVAAGPATVGLWDHFVEQVHRLADAADRRARDRVVDWGAVVGLWRTYDQLAAQTVAAPGTLPAPDVVFGVDLTRFLAAPPSVVQSWMMHTTPGLAVSSERLSRRVAIRWRFLIAEPAQRHFVYLVNSYGRLSEDVEGYPRPTAYRYGTGASVTRSR